MNSTAVGKITKTFGFEGHLQLKLEHPQTKISKMEWVFIEYDGLLVPFFLQECTQKNAQLYIIKLGSLDQAEHVDDMVGCVVYLDGNLPLEAPAQSTLVGFKLMDGQKNLVGRIMDLQDIPGNPLLEVETSKGIVLVPFHEQLILDIDHQKQIVFMKIPEGLLD